MPLLDVDVTWAKQVYDVNVWGPLAVTQAFGPLVVEAKGIIANLSSIGCKIPMCWAGKSLPSFPVFREETNSPSDEQVSIPAPRLPSLKCQRR